MCLKKRDASSAHLTSKKPSAGDSLSAQSSLQTLLGPSLCVYIHVLLDWELPEHGIRDICDPMPSTS